MNNRPIILDYACNRKRENSTSFFYDYQQDINVILTDYSCVPFIESSVSNMSFHTQTRVNRECDDEDYSCAELFTKTDAQREQDDETMISLAELVSKTFADRERDDEDDFTYYQ